MLERARLAYGQNIEQIELKGFSRSIAEIEWLLLALVLLHYQVAETDDASRPYVLLAMMAYAAFVAAYRYWFVARDESRWKLMLEIIVMIAFVSYVLWYNGKAQSSLLNLYILVIIASAITLGKLRTILVVGVIAACYVVMALSMNPDRAFSLTIFSQMLARLAPLLLIAYLTTLLASDLRSTKALYKELSELDELTGLVNARAFNNRLAAEVRRGARYHAPFTLLMIDCDNLKAVNDVHGHEAGNKMLQAIADAANGCLRRTDTLARYGGDEFVVLLLNTAGEGGLLNAERIRRAVADKRIDVRGQLVATTVSIGVADYPNDAVEARDLVEKADAALYQSKRDGRDRVTAYSRLTREATAEAADP